MTENQADTPTAKAGVDRFLQTLVSIVNQTNVGVEITLNVGGLLLSGELISVKSYFEGVAREMIFTKADYTTKEAFQKTFKQACAQFQPESEEISSENQPLPTYIHLKNARPIHADGQPLSPHKGMWWRSRLNAVDGFSLSHYH